MTLGRMIYMPFVGSDLKAGNDREVEDIEEAIV